jgi:hypothetical protein
MGFSYVFKCQYIQNEVFFMRLWSIHPKYLDTKGLVALWRETLLAQAVLQGKTKGYKNHPQLDRFKQHPSPLSAMGTYLSAIHQHALMRGYDFDESKIGSLRTSSLIPVTKGQVKYERDWLLEKLKGRAPEQMEVIFHEEEMEIHPLFFLVEGEIESWEKI